MTVAEFCMYEPQADIDHLAVLVGIVILHCLLCREYEMPHSHLSARVAWAGSWGTVLMQLELT